MRMATLTAPMAFDSSQQNGRSAPQIPLGALITLPQDPTSSGAARSMQGLMASGTAYLAKGRMFTRGFTDAAAVWEGKARRGERFGVHLWMDNSLLLWRQDRAGVWALYPSPLELLSVWKIQGVSYTAGIENGRPPVFTSYTLSYSQKDAPIGPLFEGPAFVGCTDEQAHRALAISQAALLQQLSDLADTIPQQPKLLPADGRAKPGTGRTIVPALLGSPLGDQGTRDAVLRALVEPLLAQAVARKTFQGEARCKVEAGTMAANGAIAKPPALHVDIDAYDGRRSPAGHRSYLFSPVLSEQDKALQKSLADVFAQAWTDGALGNPYHWIHTGGAHRHTVARFSFDSEGLTAHRLLSLLAPAPEKARSARGAHPSASLPLPS